mgnify:FL=1
MQAHRHEQGIFRKFRCRGNEGAIKAARKYSFDHYGKGRDVVITLVNSFHGRTIATLTATGQEVFHNYFGPFNEALSIPPPATSKASGNWWTAIPVPLCWS